MIENISEIESKIRYQKYPLEELRKNAARLEEENFFFRSGKGKKKDLAKLNMRKLKQMKIPHTDN